ncbi:unnamed protein product [Rotaria sordida]|uniref:ribose-5-phosphate isomerase n=1 Tax=Rotaria sordida TaxID=392033 RepID=A0A815MCL7_9BILA|nr:unnamed protein product [Rotaria sordida]
MECILLVTSYPNLTELKIFNCQRDNSLDYFTEYLNIIETSICAYPDLSIRYLSSNIFSSSILTYLSINVGTLTDCIYLLDGRLKQLNTFIIRIYQMDLDSSIVHNLLDVAIDGVSEIDVQFNCLKGGGGGCHTQEKLVASCAKKFIVIGDEAKWSQNLGDKWKMKIREGTGKLGPVITDNGHFILDWKFDPQVAPINWSNINEKLKMISGRKVFS